MGEKKKVTVAIVNRNYPPFAGITGDSAAELASFLVSKSIDVSIIHVKADYKGGIASNTPSGKIITIRTFFNGKHKFLRLISSLVEGYRLINKAISLKADIVICMTDPPLLNFWASFLFKKKQKWFFWSMDLYPEGFVSGNLISDNNFIYTLLNKVLRKYPPRYIIGLGGYQIGYLTKKLGAHIDNSILPCGIFEGNSTLDFPSPSWTKENRILLGYCGNLGEAHSIEFLFSIIENLEPSKFHLVLAIYGSKADELIEFAKGRPGVSIVKNVLRRDLKFIDIHLATLEKNWVNVCVPSKTVSSVCAGSAFLYFGIENSDNWHLLKEAGWLLNDLNDVKYFLNNVSRAEIEAKKQRADELAKQLIILRSDSFNQIYSKIIENAG